VIRQRLHESLKWALPPLLLVITGATPPPISEIEIVPSAVFVYHDGQGPTSFDLEARLWTAGPTGRLSITPSQGYGNLTWTANPTWLTLTPRPGFRATATVAAGQSGTVSVTVKAVSSVSDPIQVVVAPGPPPGEDFLTSTYTAGMVPDAVVVNGVRTTLGGPCGVTLSPYVAGSKLGNLVEPCGGVDGGWGAAVLSKDRRLTFMPDPWTDQPDKLDAGPAQGSLRAIPLAVRIMVGDDAASDAELTTFRQDVLVTARDDIAAANGVLADTRTGLELVEVNAATIETAEGEAGESGDLAESGEATESEEVVIYDCLEGDEITSSHDYPGVLNVYYVNGLGGYTGKACTWHGGRKQPVIYISMDNHLQSTFAHELGHVLALTLPYDGHIEQLGGLDVSNVMAGGYYDEATGGRRRLSVGQVFRMNADSGSWLNWANTTGGLAVREATAPRLPCQCGVQDPAGRCPRLADDVARPSAATETMPPWACFDKLLIASAPKDEKAAAIITGRRWRAKTDKCSPELPGWTANYWDGVYVALDNLDRAGDCDSWAAIFFKRHGARFVLLEEPNYTWTAIADELIIPGGVVPRVPILVHVYNTSGLAQATVDQDVLHARKVFGPLNRSGIKLQFSMHTGACPAVAPPLREINLCYVSGLGKEATQTGRSIKVDLRRPTTVSHFIGRALKLGWLGAGDPDLKDNIMRKSPAERGRKLTLGQVYRLNASLGVLPPCTAAWCPSLGMDVSP
jgi:hypothetical protein